MGDISIVIPARNAAGTIAIAIRSVLLSPVVSQIVVVDDGSTDATRHRAGEIGDDRIIMVDGPEKGIAAALNAGLAVVSGRYCARCDADDFYPDHRLEAQRDWLERNPNHVAISAGYTTIDPLGRKVADLSQGGVARDVTTDLRRGAVKTHFCTWLTRTEALRSIGGARTWFETAEDLDLQFRLAEVGSVWHDPVNGYFYRLHEASITHRQSRDRRTFFETAATQFARQRMQSGSDDLMQGSPPEPPAVSPNAGSLPQTSRSQIAGQLEGTAWKAFRSGNRRQARQAMLRSIGMDPFRMRRWWGLASMLVKRSGRRS